MPAIVYQTNKKTGVESKPGHGTTVNVHLIKERRRAQRTMRPNNDKLDSL